MIIYVENCFAVLDSFIGKMTGYGLDVSEEERALCLLHSI
jgi:hypoxanthine-guanine phosphoribosyltransferase